MTSLRERNSVPIEVTAEVLEQASCGFARNDIHTLIDGKAKSAVCYACGGTSMVQKDGVIYFRGQCISTPAPLEEENSEI